MKIELRGDWPEHAIINFFKMIRNRSKNIFCIIVF
ncbi:hypothetical protein ES705_30372 [subsurface metagenome]